MNVDDAPAPKPVFNNAAVTEILEETGLSLAKGMTTGEFQEALEEVACEHYWNEFTQPAPASKQLYQLRCAGRSVGHTFSAQEPSCRHRAIREASIQRNFAAALCREGRGIH